MDASKTQTEGLLQQFNLNFQQSRNEMIERFLSDQDNLNKKFAEYELLSDDEVKRAGGQSQNAGITLDDINNKYGNKGQPQHSDDENSVTSLMTEFSFSGHSDEFMPKSAKPERPQTREMSSKRTVSKDKPNTAKSKSGRNSAFKNKSGDMNSTQANSMMPGNNADMQRPSSSASRSREEVCQKLSLSTPRFGVPERNKDQPLARSKSLRGPIKQQHQPVSNVISPLEPPPNSPEPIHKNKNNEFGKPPLDNIKTGRKDKQEKPKKLLTKRFIRPKTAMGLQSNTSGLLTLVTESEPLDIFHHQNPNTWDEKESVRTCVAVRSAPLPIRHRVISWEQTECSNDELFSNNLAIRPKSAHGNRVAPLPLSLNSNREGNQQPSYATNNEANQMTSNKRIPRSKSINVKPLNKSKSGYFPSSGIDMSKTTNGILEFETMNIIANTPSNIANNIKQESGILRRFKNNGNLSSGSRGTQLAVLKLPPVKKKSHVPDGQPRSSTSMGYFRKETTV